MRGLETLQVIRQRTSAARLPVTMLTPSDRSDDVIEAPAPGANDYVTKSVKLAVVMSPIRTHVDCCPLGAHEVEAVTRARAHHPQDVALSALAIARQAHLCAVAPGRTLRSDKMMSEERVCLSIACH